MQHLFKGRTLGDDVDIDNLAAKTEGFVVQDLVDLGNRAIFEAYRVANLTDQSNFLFLIFLKFFYCIFLL